MKSIQVDFYSDTITRPTRAMREFMCQAEVGNEQEREDPSVNRLVEMVCELLGKEDAIYLPSGAMCNQIAYRVHCAPGDEIIMDETSHPIHFEVGAVAALSGASICPVKGDRGVFSGKDVEAAIRPENNHCTITRLVSVEQTTNLGGGAVWSKEQLDEVAEVAHNHSLSTHMDGARLMNAVVASGVSADQMVEAYDSVWIDFSKGLGAPVGAVLAGSDQFIRQAWRFKHQFGGAMRQAGIIAAACVYALANHVDRLAEDHANAAALAEGISRIDGIEVEPVDTNIVFFGVKELGVSASEFAEKLLEEGIRVIAVGPTRLRALTHLDVDREGVERALGAMDRLCTTLSPSS